MTPARVPTPTEDLWEAYSLIYGFLNETLFDNVLPDCILNFATHGRSNAFFTPARWQQKNSAKGTEHVEGKGRTTAHELSLNPVLLDGPVELVLAWIVRLMVQLHLYTSTNRAIIQQLSMTPCGPLAYHAQATAHPLASALATA